jgi:hypothetical protein
VAYLLKQQDGRGIEDYVGQEGGIQALAMLALLKSGVQPDDKRVSKLLGKVRDLQLKKTYVVALQTHVYCAALPKKDLVDALRRNVDWLEKAQLTTGPRQGAWSYGKEPVIANIPQGDNSNTQFAMLALHEADCAGAATNEKTWRRALDHWLNEQREDGSWGYFPGLGGAGGMTCAGVACVSIAAQHVTDKAKVDTAQASVRRAEKWLAKNFQLEANPPQQAGKFRLWHFCYLYDLERAAALADWSKIGDHDWREEGASLLLKEQANDGSWKGSGFAETDPVISTSLALLFLRPELPEKPKVADKKS